MADRAGNVSGDIEMRWTDCRKRYDHEVHEQEYQFAVDQAAENGVFEEHTKFSAGQVINGRSRERDREMTEKANRSGCPSHLLRPSSKDATGNTLQDPIRRGAHQTESNKSLSDIQDPGNEPTPEYRRGRGIGVS